MHLIKQRKEKREKRKVKRDRGFTLIEMITVIAIFGILTAIVVGNYSKFTNDAVLTNMAYEIALSIREAQTYGVAVTNRSASFENSFGISFDTSSETQIYTLYEDKNSNNVLDSGEDIKTYTLQRSIKIIDVEDDDCNTVSNNLLNIIFDRPNPEPTINGSDDLSGARIVIQSPELTKRYVVIRNNGQIYVDSNPECPF